MEGVIAFTILAEPVLARARIRRSAAQTALYCLAGADGGDAAEDMRT
jgi:hypothetical protein